MVGLKELANDLVTDALISGDSSQVPSSGEKKRKQKCCGTGFRAGLKSIVMQQPRESAYFSFASYWFKSGAYVRCS